MTIILGSIFGTRYYRKKTNRKWSPDTAVSDKRVTVLTALLPFILFGVNFILSAILLNASLSEITHKTYLPYSTDYYELLEDYWLPIAVINLFAALVYGISLAIFAARLNRRGKKLCIIFYGAEHPKLVPELETEYRESMKIYRAQTEAYRAQQREWRTYRRKLAYYEEGVPYREGGGENGQI